ncbi:MAG TPA: aminotransferase class IV [Kofleriaceae bacterium]|nr:aminotransferase class IV [Kofleriaceae bacterium]
MKIAIDGALVAPERAQISVLDRGLLYGDGLFEVLRTWRGVAVDLDAHLDRLYASAEALALRAMPREALAASVRDAIAAAGAGEHRIRIVLTRGAGALGERLAALGPGRSIVIVEPLPAQPVALAAAVVDWPLPRRAGAGHKALAYLDHLVARELAAAAGADEAIRLDPDGDVAEGATSSVFAVVAGRVVTPPLAGALPGITRARVLAICARLAIPHAVRRLPLAELRAADELFATSALRGVVPITRLDARELPAGPVTAHIALAHAQMMEGLL